MEEILIFLPLIIITGLISCYYDIKKGIIPNKLTYSMLLIGINIHVILIYFNWNNLNPDYIYTAIINFLITVLLAFWWWKIKLWYGGDAKLFIVYSLLIPISTYQYGYVNYFPALVILINTFLPAAFFFLFETLKKPSKLLIKPIIISLLNIFALSQIPILLGIENWILIFLIVLGLSELFEIIPYGTILQIVFVIIRIATDKNIWSLSFLVYFMLWAFLLLIAKQIIAQKSELLVHKAKAIEGGIIAEEISLGKKILQKETLLNKEQANSLKKNILQYDTIPFAPCLFIGVIITIASKGIFLMLIKLI